MKIYSHLPKHEVATVCIGKEWYRFPSHYFVSSNIRVEFVKSTFNGLLPTKFDPIEKYTSEPEFINDLNRPVEDRYVDIRDCDYMVDSLKAEKYRGVEDELEPYYGLKNEWESVICYPFLDAGLTSFPARGFYLGGEKIYMNYCLLKRVEI
jgi:alpha-1,2-mannosyltransferase